MAVKPCSRCKIEKPLEDFSPDRRAASGRQPACKECHRAQVTARRATDPETHRASLRASYHRHGDRRRAEAAEWRDANRDAYRAAARASYRRRKEKHIATVTKNRRDNPERLRAWARAWRARRKDRIRGGATPAETRAWMNEQRKICYWCGRGCKGDFHIDHYEPLSRGGRHALDNLVIACAPCNLRKNAKDPFDFAREVGRLL